MMEYSCFDFGPLGVEKKVSTLEDFFHFVDAEFGLSAFADLLLVCAKDVVTGLALFLHLNPGGRKKANCKYGTRPR